MGFLRKIGRFFSFLETSRAKEKKTKKPATFVPHSYMTSTKHHVSSQSQVLYKHFNHYLTIVQWTGKICPTDLYCLLDGKEFRRKLQPGTFGHTFLKPLMPSRLWREVWWRSENNRREGHSDEFILWSEDLELK